MTPRLLPTLLMLPALALPMALGACHHEDTASVKPVADADYNDSRTGGVSAPGGLGAPKNNQQQEAGANLVVNMFLWRGALDTLSFMPLVSADPYGGVITTDWWSPPTSPGERLKATAYVLGRTLRADGIRVTIFRQVRDGGQWADAPVNPANATDIENKVLARARELRAAQVK
jgi:hypothetical protein